MLTKTKFTFLLLGICLSSCASNPYYNSSKAHHTKNGFTNPGLDDDKKSFWDFMKMASQHSKPDDSNYRPKFNKNPKAMKSLEGFHVTWLGHSTCLVNINGLRILTDPIFSKRASPVSFAGPKRYIDVAYNLHELEKVDIVIISHNHYDHFDLPSIEDISKVFPNAVVYSPLGLKDEIMSQGVKKAVELDWWESNNTKGAKITSVPVQHWSKRGFFDRMKTLWSGWVIEYADKKIYFGGDTGFGEKNFQDTVSKFGYFDFAMIPVGAYDPRWFMKDYHINPEEAIKVHQILKSKKSLGIHWGTFNLTWEPMDEPPKNLKREREKIGLSEKDFFTLEHGQTVTL